MKKEYDFSNAVKNPYAERLRQQSPVDINIKIIDFFKNLSDETGIPYQTLINLYLADCVKNNKKIEVSWT
ncbi:MAG: antitoxin [Ruminococcus sp.]|nr:antitoxin [Ruminococcus sp.]MCM1380541.1 hypothetical protein [Muribaculaceae bacterium]MCM1479134.1 hypothetical protein [Muribaculaceae bacterium]